jgi:hypothetical protein
MHCFWETMGWAIFSKTHLVTLVTAISFFLEIPQNGILKPVILVRGFYFKRLREH